MSESNTVINSDFYGSVQFRQIKQYIWKPTEDITAYELALCLPALSGHGYDLEAFIDSLPESARRHFEEVK